MDGLLRASICAAVLTATVAPTTAFGQAWTRQQGEGYVNVSVSSLSGNQRYNENGDIEPIVDFSQTIVGLYAELGLLDRWLTLSLSSELFRRSELEGQGATQGLGDLQVGLWSGLIEAPFRLTVGALLGVPTGDDRPEGLGDPNTDGTAATLPTGDGEVDITPTVILGGAFGGGSWPLRHFATARAGYWLRTRGFSDGITYQLELGTQVPVTFLDRFWLIVRLRGTESFERGNDGGPTGLGNGITFTSLSGELFGRIWSSLGAAVSFDTAFRARGIIAAAPVRFTLSYEF